MTEFQDSRTLLNAVYLDALLGTFEIAAKESQQKGVEHLKTAIATLHTNSLKVGVQKSERDIFHLLCDHFDRRARMKGRYIEPHAENALEILRREIH